MSSTLYVRRPSHTYDVVLSYVTVCVSDDGREEVYVRDERISQGYDAWLSTQ